MSQVPAAEGPNESLPLVVGFENMRSQSNPHQRNGSCQAKTSVSHLISTKKRASQRKRSLEIQSAPKKWLNCMHRELRNGKVVAQNKGVAHTVTVTNPQADPIRLAVGRGVDLRRE
jgi:hypothetical protein